MVGFMSIFVGIFSSGLADLALQAQALSNLNNNSLMTLQQFGLESIMGQPNLAQLAAVANSMFNYGTSGGPVTSPTVQATQLTAQNVRQNTTRLSSATRSSTSALHTSSSAKRTRLDGTSGGNNNTGGSHQTMLLPMGARGQNLVSLVSSSNSGKTATDRTNQNRGHLSKPSSQLIEEPTPSSIPPSQHFATSLGSVIQKTDTNDKVFHELPVTSLPMQKLPHTTSISFDDILICGGCRRLFDQVDLLISHKMAGCSLESSFFTCETCRNRVDEPGNLECAYCGAMFVTAWKLMHHCHKDHGLTIFAIPSANASPVSSPIVTVSTNSESASVLKHEGQDLTNIHRGIENGNFGTCASLESRKLKNEERRDDDCVLPSVDNLDRDVCSDNEHGYQEYVEGDPVETRSSGSLSPPNSNRSSLLDRGYDYYGCIDDAHGFDSSPSSEPGTNKRSAPDRPEHNDNDDNTTSTFRSRTRRGECGHHETLADDEEDDDDDDESKEAELH